jgi:hypothetical protein
MKLDTEVSVLYGRCLHRGVLMADGHLDGDNLICGVHGWDYRSDTGVSEYNNKEVLQKFTAWIEEDNVYVDENEIIAWAAKYPPAYNRKQYLGVYDDLHGTSEEPGEKQLLAGMEWHSAELVNVTVNEETETSMSQWFYDYTNKADNNRYAYNQVSIQKWQDGKIKEERYIYSPTLKQA